MSFEQNEKSKKETKAPVYVQFNTLLHAHQMNCHFDQLQTICSLKLTVRV